MMKLVVEDKKIKCPHCGSDNCFQEDYKVEPNVVSSYMCMNCGYTTTTLYKHGSDVVKEYEETCPELFKDLSFHDKKEDLVWYPVVLNFPELGLIFPDGTNSFNWEWRAVPVVPVKDEEAIKYPIPNKPGEYYKTKADMESSRLFAQSSFYDACRFLNIIQPI